MAGTLMDAAVRDSAYQPQDRAVIQLFTENTIVAQLMSWEQIDGNIYTYFKDATLPAVAWRGVNQGYAESTGVINPEVERLMILGGEFEVDNFIMNTQPRRAPKLYADQARLKVQAMSREFTRAFFEGSPYTSPNEFRGLRDRIGGNQHIEQSANGGTLTLAKLDEAIDLVPFDNKHLFMNRVLRRKIKTLCDAAGGSVRFSWGSGNAGYGSFGAQPSMYGDIPIHIVERTGDGTTILDFDEDPGDGASDCASIYVVAFGSEQVQGIYNGRDGKSFNVENIGELQDVPRHKGRVESYLGMCIKHPRSAARLSAITNS